MIDVNFQVDKSRDKQRKIDTSEFDLMCRVRPRDPPSRRLITERPPRPGALEAEKLQREDDFRLSCWRQDRLGEYGNNE